MHAFGLRKSILNPRLFQQTCRLASTRRAARHPEARSRRPATSHPPPPRRQAQSLDQLQEEDEDDGIRWFEQDVQTGATRRVEGNPEELEAKELRQKIMALEKELQEYRDGSDEDMLAALEPDDRAKVERALKERKDRERDITSGLGVSLELPPLSVPLLKRLNAALRDTALNPTSIVRRKELWRWYCRAKYNISALPSMIPQKAWQTLWDSQSQDSTANPDRLQHMEQLLVDMASIGFELFPDQDVVYLDTLLALGKTDLAIDRWQQAYDSEGDPSESLLALGIRLFADNGHLDRAHDAMLQLFNNFPYHDSRIILPLLSATVSAGDHDLAFGYYVLLRSRLGSDMNMDDYDAVSLTFLEHDKKDLALAVFRDMMLEGNKRIEQGFLGSTQQEELYQAVFQRMERLSSHISDASELNNIPLASLSAMPVEWQNKFFYGSWLKKLIGMGQLEAATKVVELMYERGAEPDAKMMNGLVGAFLRSENQHLQDRGEQLAWTMIQQRLETTYRRRQAKRNEAVVPMPSVYETEEGVSIPPHMARPVPRGTLETFNVLALHYFSQEKWAYIYHLDRMMRPAEYKMDTFFFNHWLYMWLNNSGEKAMWSAFIKEAKRTACDMETYNCLWTGQLKHLDPKRNKERMGYPPPRQLFALMTTWFYDLSQKQKAAAIEDFNPDLYRNIISSFCANKDYAGCLVASHGIAQIFGQFPDPDIARIVVTGVSNLPEGQWATIRGRRGRQQLPSNAARLKNTSRVLAEIAKKRATTALEDGINILQLDPEARQQESLNLLSEFLRAVLVRVYQDADTAESRIQEAAQAMQLGDIPLGDKDASNVM